MTSPATPGLGWLAAKVASRPRPGTAMPKESGPTSRMPCLLHTASRSAQAAVSRPEVITARAFTPSRPQSSATSRTAGAGTAIRARSGDSGRSATARAQLHAAELRRLRVDRVQAARVPAAADVVQDGPARRARPPAGADHDDGLRREDMAQAGGVGAALAPGHRLQEGVQRGAGVVSGERDRHLGHAIVVVTLDREPGVGEQVQHRGVLRQHLRGERRHALAPGGRDQVLEQERRDTSVVHVLGDRERDLGAHRRSLLVGGDVVAGDAHHLAGRQREQRDPARRARPADPLRLVFGRQRAEAEETEVGVVR